MDESTLKKILESRDYDIRKSGNGRFMDQKCIPDVVCAVAECVLDYVDGDNLKTFTKNDIWHFFRIIWNRDWKFLECTYIATSIKRKHNLETVSLHDMWTYLILV